MYTVLMNIPHALAPLLQTIRFQLTMLSDNVAQLEQAMNDQASRSQGNSASMAPQALGTQLPGNQPKKKRMLSAAGRRRIAEATRKRWADKRKAEAAAAASRPAAKKSVQAKRAAS